MWGCGGRCASTSPQSYIEVGFKRGLHEGEGEMRKGCLGGHKFKYGNAGSSPKTILTIHLLLQVLHT